MSDFTIGLQVTAIGMALVFLTLILVMLVIMALDRVFKGTGNEEVATGGVVTLPVTAEADSNGADLLDEVAAIAVALVAAAQGVAAHVGRPAAQPAGGVPRMVFDVESDGEELPGEVVRVAMIEPGSRNWAGHGRLQATQ
jgi:Na+-transporting methylmalonyl-CoA/oxaloacetate decarboxylase gamma subunit